VCRTCEDGDLAIAEQGVGLHLGRTKPAEHPRLVLKGSHSNKYRDSGLRGQFGTCAVPASKGAQQQVCDNKPGSHPDYAHHEVLYHPSYSERLSTSHHIDSMWSRSFQQGCALQCLAESQLILQYLNLATNQEKEFSGELDTCQTGLRRDAKLRTQNLAEAKCPAIRPII
jgi:hypothetical protein